MASNISPTTGEIFYSGTWKEVADLARTLSVGAGKLSKITESQVSELQELVDRQIDADLNQYYDTPLRYYNKYIPAKDETIKMYPGAITYLARYWVAGLLLTAEHQGIQPNETTVGMQYIEESRRQLYDIQRFVVRLEGQKLKHNLRTMSPTMAPGINPEPNF